jgi:DNA-binding LacI/PurR family transcriptional regulator
MRKVSPVPVTIYDIAKKADVSYATASRVLNGNNYGKRSDSRRRAQEVLRIAEEEGYQPNSAAQALVGKSTHNICLLISDHIQSGWSNAYFSQVLGGVEKACHEHDYGLVLNSYQNDGFDAFFARRKLGGRSFDGIVFAGYVTTEMSQKLRQHKVPFISINKHFENPDEIPAYYSDGSEFDIALYAHRCGHRNIGFVDEGIYPDFQQLRNQLVAAGLSDCQVTPLPIDVPGDFHCGAAVMEQYYQLSEAQRPTFIAANYQTCAALLKEFKKLKISCPGDISLVSRCESEVCQMIEPELTVIAPDQETIGQVATKRLITFLEEKKSLTYERCQNQINVVERQSVKVIPQGEL